MWLLQGPNLHITKIIHSPSPRVAIDTSQVTNSQYNELTASADCMCFNEKKQSGATYGFNSINRSHASANTSVDNSLAFS